MQREHRGPGVHQVIGATACSARVVHQVGVLAAQGDAVAGNFQVACGGEDHGPGLAAIGARELTQLTVVGLQVAQFQALHLLTELQGHHRSFTHFEGGFVHDHAAEDRPHGVEHGAVGARSRVVATAAVLQTRGHRQRAPFCRLVQTHQHMAIGHVRVFDDHGLCGAASVDHDPIADRDFGGVKGDLDGQIARGAHFGGVELGIVVGVRQDADFRGQATIGHGLGQQVEFESVRDLQASQVGGSDHDVQDRRGCATGCQTTEAAGAGVKTQPSRQGTAIGQGGLEGDHIVAVDIRKVGRQTADGNAFADGK